MFYLTNLTKTHMSQTDHNVLALFQSGGFPGLLNNMAAIMTHPSVGFKKLPLSLCTHFIEELYCHEACFG